MRNFLVKGVGIAFLSLLASMQVAGQIKVVQVAHAETQEITCNSDSIQSPCSPQLTQMTINFNPTLPGSTLAMFYRGGTDGGGGPVLSCKDNLGVTLSFAKTYNPWGMNIAYTWWTSPSSGGVSSVTCQLGSLTYPWDYNSVAMSVYEVSGRPSLSYVTTWSPAVYIPNVAPGSIPCTYDPIYGVRTMPAALPSKPLSIFAISSYDGSGTVTPSYSSGSTTIERTFQGTTTTTTEITLSTFWVEGSFNGIFSVSGMGDYTYINCVGLIYSEPPLAGDDETDKCCNDSAGSPINLVNGNTYIIQSDLKLPGLGGGLTLERTWNSRWPATQASLQSGIFGPNWRSTYEESVFPGADGTLKYARADGSFWSFPITTGAVLAPANGNARIATGPGYWTISFKDGETRQFSYNNGLLNVIKDRNGNATQLSYDNWNRLVSVTDAASRHLYFTYASDAVPHQVVKSVTTDVGLTVSYSYDSCGRLVKVTNPDQTTLSFVYNDQSMITAVLDSNGKILESHTYDRSNRGLSSSRANGVDALTISYPASQ